MAPKQTLFQAQIQAAAYRQRLNTGINQGLSGMVVLVVCALAAWQLKSTFQLSWLELGFFLTVGLLVNLSTAIALGDYDPFEITARPRPILGWSANLLLLCLTLLVGTIWSCSAAAMALSFLTGVIGAIALSYLVAGFLRSLE